MNIITDSNKKGVFAVVSPIDLVFFDTFRATPVEALEAFCRTYKMEQDQALRDGYTVSEFGQTGLVTGLGPVPTVDESTVSAQLARAGIPKTAAAWGIYEEQPGAEAAAKEIVQVLEKMLNGALGAGITTVTEGNRIYKSVWSLMRYHQHLGARSVEAEAILIRTIEAALGLPRCSIERC